MTDSNRPDLALANSELPDIVRRVRARTPARLLVGRAGLSYRTATQLDLGEAHAAARDAVRAYLVLPATFSAEFISRWNLFEVCTKVREKKEYLLRPDLGRHFDPDSRLVIEQRCPREADLQIVIGDGLSVSAIQAQIPSLLPLLWDGAAGRNWTLGRVFVVRHCRVGILNEIGELLNPSVVVLLIGERPGLSTAQSLSAYMAYRPCPSHTDADRNLISNIHARGLASQEAAERILDLVARMMKTHTSGYLLQGRSIRGDLLVSERKRATLPS